eukprot:scaffold9053_cov73-Phaeocystis_antarctica.AAC.1
MERRVMTGTRSAEAEAIASRRSMACGSSQWHGVQAVWFAVPDAQAVRSGCAVGSWHSAACMLSERNLRASRTKS